MPKNLLAVTVVILFLSACSFHFNIDFLGEDDIQEIEIVPASSKNKILLMDISGVIHSAPDPGLLNKEGDILSRVKIRLQKARQDPWIKGVILRLDTPGGGVTASDILYHEILSFREETGIPVTALMMEVAASGGYYVASACDVIMAHPTTLTGSIGVISIFPNVKGLMNMVGVEVNVIKTGDMKDAGSLFRRLSKEDQSYFQSLIQDFYSQFLDVVHQARRDHLSRSELERLADGRVFTATQALEKGLVDEIGYFKQAYQRIQDLAGVQDARVIAYTYYPDRKTNIYAQTSMQRGQPGFTDLRFLISSLQAGFYYLWLPHTN
jgi:protease IV